MLQWFDTSSSVQASRPIIPAADRIDWLRTLPFILMHAACLLVFVVGVSPVALSGLRGAVFPAHVRHHGVLSPLLLAQVVQDFARRRSSCSACSAPRPCSAGPSGGPRIIAIITSTRTRKKTRTRPIQHGFVRAHMSWFLSKKGFAPDLKRVRDLMNFPELRWLDRFDIIVPVLFAVAVFFLGVALEKFAPGLGTNGWQMLVWGFFVSTVLCSHGTYTINSLSHVFGKQRYKHRRLEPQQLVPRADHARRGLAQQPPPLPELHAPGLLLVGNRHHLLPAEGDVVARHHLGSEAGAGLGARPSRAGIKPLKKSGCAVHRAAAAYAVPGVRAWREQQHDDAHVHRGGSAGRRPTRHTRVARNSRQNDPNIGDQVQTRQHARRRYAPSGAPVRSMTINQIANASSAT